MPPTSIDLLVTGHRRRGELHLSLRKRRHDVGDVFRQHRVARGVIAVIGSGDVPLDRLGRDLRDRVEHLLRRVGAALAVGDENTVVTDNEQADRGEPWLANLFVAVDVVGKLDRAREVGELEAALVRISGPHLLALSEALARERRVEGGRRQHGHERQGHRKHRTHRHQPSHGRWQWYHAVTARRSGRDHEGWRRRRRTRMCPGGASRWRREGMRPSRSDRARCRR